MQATEVPALLFFDDIQILTKHFSDAIFAPPRPLFVGLNKYHSAANVGVSSIVHFCQYLQKN
jgi:hypothetical protein